MAVSPSGAAAVGPDPALPDVLAHFGIPLGSWEVLGPLVAGTGRHRGFRVRAEGREWAVKRHSSGATVERLASTHALELRLADNGFPVAPLRRTRDGETLVREGSAWYSLHGWAEGQQVSIADRDVTIGDHPDLVGDLARLIAALHQASGPGTDGGDVVNPDRLLELPRGMLHEIRRPRRHLLSRWQALRLKPSKSEFDRWILHVLPELAERADRLSRQSITPGVGGSDILLIHNDVNWENLIFDERFRVRALLDFDNAVPAPRALEVGACAVVLVGSDPVRVEMFVSAYEAASGVPLDRELVGLAMELKCVRSVLASVLAHLGHGTDIAELRTWSHHLYESLQALPQR